jgi:release factor glutamine methyltransferase
MQEAVTVRGALREGAERLRPSPSAGRDAELLLRHALGKDRAWVLTHPEETVGPSALHTYQESIHRRARREPVQYIVGEQEFFGLAFRVTRDVLIPRPETEHLVEAALARLAANVVLRIADVGTGSGAIAVALAHALPRARVTALDLSPAALAIAAGNAQRHGVEDRVEFRESDLLGAVRGQVFDSIVSNPPYVALTDELEPQVRDYEPAEALYAGETGLDIYRRLIPEARAALKPGGLLLMEMGHGQGEALAAMLEGWRSVAFVDDLRGIPRVVVAQRVA